MKQSLADSIDVWGFWIYILSDCILFSTLFSTYAMLHNHVYGGVSLKALMDIPSILIETIILLASSFTYGLAILNVYKNKIKPIVFWLIATFILGALFVGMEMNEFIHLYHEGHSWQSNAALSAFFTLVGTHGLHVSIGLIWMLVLITQVLILGVSPVMKKRLTYLGLFWAFLDVIWIFVFTIVYLMGAI